MVPKFFERDFEQLQPSRLKAGRLKLLKMRLSGQFNSPDEPCSVAQDKSHKEHGSQDCYQVVLLEVGWRDFHAQIALAVLSGAQIAN
jgi:hypothetical protein